MTEPKSPVAAQIITEEKLREHVKNGNGTQKLSRSDPKVREQNC